MLSDIKKIQIFIIFFLSVITCDLKAWDFFVYHTSDVLPEISVKSIKPFDLYESKIKTFFFKILLQHKLLVCLFTVTFSERKLYGIIHRGENISMRF